MERWSLGANVVALLLLLSAASHGRELPVKNSDHSFIYNHTLAKTLVEYASAITLQKEEDLNLHSVDAVSDTISPPVALVRPPETPKNDDDTLTPKAAANLNASEDLGGGSATRTQKSGTKKRTRSSPTNKKAKKLFQDDGLGDDDDGDASANDEA